MFLLQFSFKAKLLPSSIGKVEDYHLPVSVELVNLPADSLRVSPQAIRAESKPQADAPRVIHRVSHVVEESPSKPAAKKSSLLKPVKSHLGLNESKLVSFTQVLSSSSKTWNRAPIYPESARRLGREGRVILDAQIDDAGHVISVRVARSSGSFDLDQAAIEAVEEWTMDVPKDGSRRLFIPITFRFNSSS